MAPRRLWRVCGGLARGAWLAAGVWLAGAAAADGPVSARYDGPTLRYPHAVLGDGVEYTTLTVDLADGTRVSATHPPPLVFEDIAPRLADLDGDGRAEIITVEAHERQGARLALWEVTDGALRPLTATPFIGTRFRWLAPIGAADLDGDGQIEIAYIDRPHLAKTLRIWRYDPLRRSLSQVAAAAGFSNHRIGWPYIEGGIARCGGNGPEMVMATGDWREAVALRFDGETISGRVLAPYAPEAIADALACRTAD